MVILSGPAGTGGASEQGFIDIKEAGLSAVEIEFTYGVWMTPAQAKKIAELNKKLKLKLSIHAPYFINLNSKEKAKVYASKKRILKCCEIGNMVGAKNIVFHPGYYMKMPEQKVFENIKKEILDLQKTIKAKKYNVVLCPETMGKQSQFGSLEELKKLKKQTKCSICVDFSHVIGRGEAKNYEEVVKKIKNIGYVHTHMTGVDYSNKSLPHKTTPEKEIKELLTALKKHKVSCTIINESPSPFKDAIKTNKILKKLK